MRSQARLLSAQEESSMSMRRPISGFTLIELLVVIVIIGLLVSIALPMLSKAKMKAKEMEAISNFHAIHRALESFGTDHNGFYPYRMLCFQNETDVGPIYSCQYPGWQPMGLVGGVPIVTSSGSVDNAALRTAQPRLDQTLPRLFNQYSDPLVALGYMDGGKYPENPFIKRPIGFINWSWGDDVGVPASNVFVSPGDIVYTFFPVIRLDNQWHDAEGVLPNKLPKYQVTTDSGYQLNAVLGATWFGLDLIDSYQMWVYGNLPLTASQTGVVWYSAYENSQMPGPPKRVVEIRQDWNGSGKEDLFEAGIIAYESGGTGADSRQQNPDPSAPNRNEGGTFEF